ncbi:MAG: CHAP domain-containing protein [bacterium]|nr:CHAP domain-containing protein [bacterium]
MAFDYKGAKAAGFTDEQIEEHLIAKGAGFGIRAAKEAGFTDDQIAEHLKNKTTKEKPTALESVAKGVGTAMWKATPILQNIPTPDVIKTLLAVNELPSNLIGGALQTANQIGEGTYQAPDLGEFKVGNKTVKTGELVLPALVGAARGVASGVKGEENRPTVMSELPKVVETSEQAQEPQPQQIPQIDQATGQPLIGDTGASFDVNIPNGYQFAPGGLSGQCAWFSERITTLPNGQNWTIGNTITDKKNQLANHVKNGNAFYLGDDTPQVGNSIVFNGGKYGHVATIAKINPDGTAQLIESNYNNDRRVTKNRTISLADPSILGFLKTVPRK